MGSKVLPIEVPEGLPGSLRMSDEEFAREAKMLLAAKLYELGKVPQSVAAEIAGVDRLTFLELLGRYGVPAINLRDEEGEREVEAARRLAEQ